MTDQVQQEAGVPAQGSPQAATGEQLSLVRAHVRGERTLPGVAAPERDASLALVDPVAEVQVQVPLPHLDRLFEYSVPVELADEAVPGARVRVRFSGQEVEGFVVARKERAEHAGRLAPLRRVVSPEPVLTHAVLTTCRDVARRYAGTVADVVRLAVPPRHAAAEKALGESTPAPVEPPDPGAWREVRAGEAFLRRLGAGESPWACWTATPSGGAPDRDWPVMLAVAAATCLAAGRGAILVVPDHRDVARVDAALTEVMGKGAHVRLTASQGPQARYTAWLKVLRGQVRCVVGTRAAMFAPVRDLGLVAWWDDGDDLLTEPRAPYPHVREVLLARALREGAAALAGSFARSVELQSLVEEGRMAVVSADAAAVRRAAPRVVVAGEGHEQERDPAAASAHLPSLAWRTAKSALGTGPVLVQVPRRGYAPSLSCQRCRMPARCPACHGPLALGGRDAPPRCRWCGRTVDRYECPQCEGSVLRSSVVGARRTAEELGRAFPGVPVVTSGGDSVVEQVEDRPALVIATPGAEPVAPTGYAAVLLLDAWASLDRPDLDAAVEALRRWLAAAALARSSADGATAVLCGAPVDVPVPPVEALVRWDPSWLAARELAERRELSLPPAVSLARLEGERHALADAVASVGLGDTVERLGPLPAPAPPRRGPRTAEDERPRQRILLRTPHEHALDLADALRSMRAVRSARKESDLVHVVVDPRDGLA